MIDLEKGLFYTFFSTLALVSVYLWGFPEAIPGGPALTAAAPLYVWTLGYWTANLAWWLACIFLWYGFLRSVERAPGWRSPLEQKASQMVPASRLALPRIKVRTPDSRENGDNSSSPP
jgi:hypothetical protein